MHRVAGTYTFTGHGPDHRPWWSRPVRIDVCSMFARMSRYAPAARGIHRPPRLQANAQNGRWRHVSSSSDSSSEGIIELSSRLLICGFGVQVPGGAPILTWGYTRSGASRDGRFRVMFAPRLLGSPDLVPRAGRGTH